MVPLEDQGVREQEDAGSVQTATQVWHLPKDGGRSAGQEKALTAARLQGISLGWASPSPGVQMAHKGALLWAETARPWYSAMLCHWPGLQEKSVALDQMLWRIP